jgi:hypothetical protein
VTTTTKPTVREAKQVIDNNYTRFMDGQYIDPLALDIIGYSVANELQLRDYLLGYAIETGSKDLAVKYVSHLIEQGVAEQHRHALYTVLSALYFMNGDRDLAYMALDEARTLSPNYSLLSLLTRVYGSGWPTEAFDAMTAELHPKVLAEIETIADRVIEIA